MKKKAYLYALALCAFATLCASCDSKVCYCYDNGREEVLYVNPDVKCDAYSSGRRGCVEANERMDPSEIGQEYRKR